MLLSETVTQKVGRKLEREGMSSEVGRVINNVKAVYGKKKDKSREKRAGKQRLKKKWEH